MLVAGVLQARAQTISLRDEFNGGLEPGWTWLNEDPARYSFTSRPGYLRILSQRGGIGTETGARNFLVREVTGDFIMEASVEFDPTVAAQSAGIVVYVNDATGVALGLSHAEGERGTFRGVGFLSSEGSPDTHQTTGAFYNEDHSSNPNLVYLRLLRNGNQFVSAFSPNGIQYAELTTFVNNAIPETVLVGLGASNGDYDGCGADCDTTTPADFDFFQLSTFGDDGNGDGGTPEPVLQQLTLEGPEAVTSGASADFTAIGAYNDGSTQNLTGQATWMVAPPEYASVSGGTLTAGTVDTPTQITLVADVSQEVAGTIVTRTATMLVRIDPEGTGGSPPLCGMQAAAASLAGLTLMAVLPWRRRWSQPSGRRAPCTKATTFT